MLKSDFWEEIREIKKKEVWWYCRSFHYHAWGSLIPNIYRDEDGNMHDWDDKSCRWEIKLFPYLLIEVARICLFRCTMVWKLSLSTNRLQYAFLDRLRSCQAITIWWLFNKFDRPLILLNMCHCLIWQAELSGEIFDMANPSHIKGQQVEWKVFHWWECWWLLVVDTKLACIL